ncbi:zinc finger protein 569-like [Frieseomelitta varia]|uniref:zinc finger protein 569-like n=1 Tax=Frieseomelitta varia TaxID=561572 RepID=UPI001CB68136|nr:zinc finger protein 569-like [Frieseomelitta varia]
MRMYCLKRHLRVECSQTPKYQCHMCRMCQNWFKYKHNLTAHMKIHVEQPRHYCNLCPKRFYRRDKLVKRQKRWPGSMETRNRSDAVPVPEMLQIF